MKKLKKDLLEKNQKNELSRLYWKQYKLEWLKSAVKDLASLPVEEKTKILNKIDFLQKDPDQLDIKKLQGYKNLFRIRSGKYRIVIKIVRPEKKIYVSAIAHRKDIYNLLNKLSLMFSIGLSFGIH